MKHDTRPNGDAHTMQVNARGTEHCDMCGQGLRVNYRAVALYYKRERRGLFCTRCVEKMQDALDRVPVDIREVENTEAKNDT